DLSTEPQHQLGVTLGSRPLLPMRPGPLFIGFWAFSIFPLYVGAFVVFDQISSPSACTAVLLHPSRAIRCTARADPARGAALRLYAPWDQLRCGTAPIVRLSHRQLFQYSSRISAGAESIGPAGD